MSAAPRPSTVSDLRAEANDHDAPEPAQVAICRVWLRRWAYPTKSINKRLDSYSLKHTVERSTIAPGVTHWQTDRFGRRWGGIYVYVSSGAFIRAAELEGYRIVPSAGGEALFNIGIRKVPLSALEVLQ